jgi:hypothetical protein
MESKGSSPFLYKLDAGFQSMFSHPTSSSSLLPDGFSTKPVHTYLFAHVPATCTTHLMLLSIITQIIFHKEYKS